MPEGKILVSACLLGIKCRYNGEGKENLLVTRLSKEYELIPVCPETLGGLKAPRAPAEIQGGDGAMVLQGLARVISKEGMDYTEAFINGAKAVLRLAGEAKPEIIILKAHSPSCGVGTIYDGSFTKRLTKGNGVTAALLCQAGYQLITELSLAEGSQILPEDS